MATYVNLKKTDSLVDKYKKGKENLENKNYLSSFDFYKINGITKGDDDISTILLENAIRTDVQKIVKHFEKTYFRKWTIAIKNYNLVGLDRQLELKRAGQEFRTNVKQPIVRTYVDRLVQSLFRSNFFIKTYSTTKSNQKKADVIQAIVTRGFFSSSAKRALLNAGTEAILTGVGYLRSGFKTPDFNMEQYGPDSKEVYESEETLPQLERVSEFNIFGEPQTPFHKQRFIVYRKILPVKSVKYKINNLNDKMNDELRDLIITNPKPISKKNYDKVRLIKYYEEEILNEAGDDYNVEQFYETTLGNDYCEYIERRDSENLIILVNGYIVYDGPNPLPKGVVSPFHYINVTNTPGSWIADGIGTLLEGPQKLYDALYNASFDLMKFQAAPVFFKQPGTVIEGAGKTFPYRPFAMIEIQGPGKLETFQIAPPDATMFKGMTDILNMANMAISPASYSQYQGVSRSATDSQARLEGLKDAVIVLTNNLNRVLAEVSERRLEEMKIKMPNKFSVPIFEDTGKIKDWKTISFKDLKGKYLFERDSESIREINKMIDRAHINDVIGLIKSLGQDPQTGQRLVNTKKILKEALDLFGQSDGVVYTDEEYKEAVIKAQKLGAEIQEELRKIAPQQGQQLEGMSPGATSSEGEEIEKPKFSNYNNDPNKKQYGEGKRQAGIDMGALLKYANE